MPRNNSRYSPENSEHLNNGYNAGETLKETFPPEKIVEAARNSPLEPAVDLGEGIKKFKDGEPGAEWSIGKSIWGAFGGGVIGKLIGGGPKGAATGAVKFRYCWNRLRSTETQRIATKFRMVNSKNRRFAEVFC